jgi:hypothetical protein
MLRLLRKLRKCFKTACLTATLATCWQIGQAAKADTSPPSWGDEVTFNFSGTVSPTVSNISHLFLIYGTGYSSLDFGPWFIKLGDFPKNESSPFSAQMNATYGESAYWMVAGLYGDVTSGQYHEGTNGVVLGLNGITEGDPWQYWNISESDAFNQLFNDAPGNGFTPFLEGNMRNGGWYGDGWHEFTDSTNLFDFSNAANNGQLQINTEVVPEPVSIILFGAGGLIVAIRRRNK